jgi:acid phosphatase (class A)
MKMRNRIAVIALALACVSCAWWWSLHAPNYLPADTSAFVAQFDPPPMEGSPQSRAELDELLSMQAQRTAAETAAARADRRKDVRQFYEALGLDAGADSRVAPLRALMERVESDVSVYVRDAKHRFARHRPYVIESRLEPCIDDVADDQSYPSGHATYGYVMAMLLAQMVPERRVALLARADEYARHRMTCGVHFASDVAAGRRGAEWLVQRFDQNPGFRSARASAADGLRTALKLPPLPAD